MSEVDEGAGLRPELTLDGIVRRVDTEERYLAVAEEQERDLAARHGMTFQPHYTSDGRDGHDDYECAAADRRYLLGLLREARAALESLAQSADVWRDDEPAIVLIRRLDPLRAEGSDPQVGHQTIEAQEDR